MNRQETAKALDLSLSGLQQLVKRGALIPHYFLDRKNRQQFFRVSDIQALKTVGGERDGDIRQVKALALMALSSARRSETRLDEVYASLGVRLTPLLRDVDSVKALYESAKVEPTRADVRDPVWLSYWGGVFFSMDDVYLSLTQEVIGDTEPWKVFMDFGSKAVRLTIAENEPALYFADKLFQSGRRHLHHVSYLYCRRLHGRKIANVTFDGTATAVSELYAILH